MSQARNPTLKKQNRKIRRSKVPFVSQRVWNQPDIHYETISKRKRERKRKRRKSIGRERKREGERKKEKNEGMKEQKKEEGKEEGSMNYFPTASP